jgi:hypothetical protein
LGCEMLGTLPFLALFASFVGTKRPESLGGQYHTESSRFCVPRLTVAGDLRGCMLSKIPQQVESVYNDQVGRFRSSHFHRHHDRITSLPINTPLQQAAITSSLRR